MTVPSVDGRPTQKTSFDQNILIGLRIQGLRLFSTMLNCSHIYRRRLWVAVGARAPQSLRNAYAFISYYYPFPPIFPPQYYMYIDKSTPVLARHAMFQLEMQIYHSL